MVVHELDELQMGMLAYWHTLGIEADPTPDWKRWCFQMLFGVPCLAEGEQPKPPMTHPAWIIAEGLDVGEMLIFHLKYLADNPTGPIARQLWKRLGCLVQEVEAAMQVLDEKEGAA